MDQRGYPLVYSNHLIRLVGVDPTMPLKWNNRMPSGFHGHRFQYFFTSVVLFWLHVIDVTRSRSYPVRYVHVLAGKEGYDHDTRVAVFSVPSENQTCRSSEARSCGIIRTHGFGASEPVLKSSRWISKHHGFGAPRTDPLHCCPRTCLIFKTLVSEYGAGSGSNV